MTARKVAFAASLVVLTSGCASSHDDARNEAAPAAEREYEALEEQPSAPPPAGAPADDAEDEPRSLADIERELAANNARLLELGVELPGSRPAEPNAGVGDGGGAKATTTVTGEPGRSTSAKPSPGQQPSAPSERKPSKRDKAGGKAGKAKDDAKGELGDDVRPDAVKATPLSPHDGGLDAAARCQQVCDLAAISCGLGDQICELADRHPDDPEYASACERANVDCEAAKEACDACAQ